MGLALSAPADAHPTVAFHAETDPGACRVLEYHYPAVPNLGDLTAVDFSHVRTPSILTAGFPCQPVSHAGKRKGINDDRWLWPSICEAVGVLRPPFVFLENVQGIRTANKGEALANIIEGLAQLGYVGRYGFVRADTAGAPHRRRRFFLLASDAENVGHERTRPARAGWPGPADGCCGEAAPDVEGSERRAPELETVEAPAGSATEPEERPSSVAFGDYEPAVRRWESVTGRPAPVPADPAGKLNPAFSEWMMGYPPGHVTAPALGLTRAQQLRAIGNAVVPQQVALAYDLLSRLEPLP